MVTSAMRDQNEDDFNEGRSRRLLELLEATDNCIVFAESCTAGLISGALARIPGASHWLAGSSVVYQLKTKTDWLGVSADALLDPGPVSQIVAEQMAVGALERTRQASVAASVTGHLGPDAPKNLDGVAWSGVAMRTNDGVAVFSRRLQLNERHVPTPEHTGVLLRQQRQVVAAGMVISFCCDVLQNDM